MKQIVLLLLCLCLCVAVIILNMLVWITFRLASLLSRRDSEIKDFLQSSDISRKMSLQLMVSKSINWWTLNVSISGRATIVVFLKDLGHFVSDTLGYEIMNTVIIYWPGLCPRVVVNCIEWNRYGSRGINQVQLPDIVHDDCFNEVIPRIPIELLVSDYSELFFPKRWKGVPQNAFRRIRSRFNCTHSSND